MKQGKRKKNCGFTILELMICVVLISVLLALAFPALRTVRSETRELKCVANAREAMRFVHFYAGDFKDYFPTWIGDSAYVTQNPGRWRRDTQQGFTVMHKPQWLNFAGITLSSPSLRCPDNQFMRNDPSGAGVNFDYWLADSFYIDPGYLNPALGGNLWSGRLGARVQQLGGVLWPDAKVGLFEHDVWHGWKGRFGAEVDLIHLEYFSSTRPGSVAYLDGHAVLSRPIAPPWVQRYPIWGYSPYGMTPWGIRGRDR